MFVTLQRFALFVLQGEYHALNQQTERWAERAFDSLYKDPLENRVRMVAGVAAYKNC